MVAPNIPPTYTIEKTAKIWNDKTKRFMGIQQMAEALKLEAQQQMDMLMNDAETGKPTPKPEYTQYFMDKRNKVMRFIEETVAANIATQLLEDVAESTFKEFSSDQTDVLSSNTFGSWIGGFMEQNMFGLPKSGNSAFSDINNQKDIWVELKAHTSTKETLQVAGITLEGIPSELNEEKRAINVAAAYRMFLKMQNFLLIRMRKEDAIRKNGKAYRKVHFEDISLHMVLLLKEVWNIIFDKTIDTLHGVMTNNPNKVVFVERQKAWDRGKATYNVKIDIGKINGVYNFVKLYLYHFDMLAEIKLNNNMRISFFKNIKYLNQTWKAQNLGTSPEFDIKIK